MRRVAAVLLAVTAVGWGATPALAAAGEPVTGYWSRTQTGLPVPVQPPTPVPEGGMWVAADPSGPLAVSALRAELLPGLVAVKLRLAVADVVGVPAVQACPSTDHWAADQGGRLEGAPAADCAAPLDGAVDGDVLVVKLPAGLDAVNVLLRPAPGSTFSLTLERATAGSVVTAPQPAAGYDPAAAPPPGELSGPAFETTALPPLVPGPATPALGAPSAPAPVAAQPVPAPQAAPAPDRPAAVGDRVVVGALGLEGVVTGIHGGSAEVDVRGKRMRASTRDLRVVAGAAQTTVRVNVDLAPRETSSAEINVIGMTVDQALERVERFLDEALVTDRRSFRVIHGFGTGQLRRAITSFLQQHPLVASVAQAPQNQGGGGATLVELKD
jgi:hypothetical protein